METLREYEIAVSGLKDGQHEFHYEIDWRFFAHFEESQVKQGRFDVDVLLDKQPDHWLVTFDISGAMDTECDRCMAPIGLPVSGRHHLIVQYHGSDTVVMDDNDSDLIYVPQDIHTWSIAELIHEFVQLSIPVQRVYACREEASPPCDDEALQRLSDEATPGSANPLKDALKYIELRK
jgi:uncharacterized protein